MRWIIVLLLFVLAAGCTDQQDKAAAQIAFGLITPEKWVVNGDTDNMMVWVHNEGLEPVDVAWTIESENGSSLPPGVQIGSSRGVSTLQANGAKSNEAGRPTYPDWDWTLLTIRVENTTSPGAMRLRLDTGVSQHPFTIEIAANRTRVSASGDTVTVQYVGRFHDDQQVFDDGSFPTQLGSGATVPGFDYGLMGLALNEKARLIIPPAFAYGYDNTDPGYVRFNGETLQFDVVITRFG